MVFVRQLINKLQTIRSYWPTLNTSCTFCAIVNIAFRRPAECGHHLQEMMECGCVIGGLQWSMKAHVWLVGGVWERTCDWWVEYKRATCDWWVEYKSARVIGGWSMWAQVWLEGRKSERTCDWRVGNVSARVIDRLQLSLSCSLYLVNKLVYSSEVYQNPTITLTIRYIGIWLYLPLSIWRILYSLCLHLAIFAAI